MPQTREHLDICQLLGVRRAPVALTKSDLVDPDWLDFVVEEVREFLAGSFLEEAPIIPVSSRTGNGIDRLRDELGLIARDLEQKRSGGRIACLWTGFLLLPVSVQLSPALSCLARLN